MLISNKFFVGCSNLKEKKRIFEKLTFFAYSQQYLLETVTQKAICRGDKNG